MKQKGFSQIYDISAPLAKSEPIFTSRTPAKLQEYTRSTPPSRSRGELTFVSRTPSDQVFARLTTPQIIPTTSPTNSEISFVQTLPDTLSLSPIIPQEYSKLNQVLIRSNSSPAETPLRSLQSSQLRSLVPSEYSRLIQNSRRPLSTPSSEKPDILLITRTPGGPSVPITSLTADEYNRLTQNLLKPISSTASSPRPELVYSPRIENSPGRQVTPQGYIKLSTLPPGKDLQNKPSPEYEYYDTSLISQLPPNSKVLVLASGAVQCLDRGNFPHPGSCKKFISCYEGGVGEGIIGWEYTCPKGLSFDPIGGICNWSAGLGCKTK